MTIRRDDRAVPAFSVEWTTIPNPPNRQYQTLRRNQPQRAGYSQPTRIAILPDEDAAPENVELV